MDNTSGTHISGTADIYGICQVKASAPAAVSEKSAHLFVLLVLVKEVDDTGLQVDLRQVEEGVEDVESLHVADLHEFVWVQLQHFLSAHERSKKGMNEKITV